MISFVFAMELNHVILVVIRQSQKGFPYIRSSRKTPNARFLLTQQYVIKFMLVRLPRTALFQVNKALLKHFDIVQDYVVQYFVLDIFDGQQVIYFLLAFQSWQVNYLYHPHCALEHEI